MNNSKRNKCVKLTILLLVILAFFVRGIDLSTHFAHYDDIGVGLDIQQAKLHSGQGFINRIKTFETIPLQWTYAPLQFVITNLLVNTDASYRELLFWSRLPSFISSMIAIGVLMFLCLKYRGEDALSLCCLMITFFSFSQENVIYSKQSGPYALGCLALLVLMALILDFANRPNFGFFRFAMIGFFLWLLSPMPVSDCSFCSGLFRGGRLGLFSTEDKNYQVTYFSLSFYPGLFDG